jgi:hypothetical protein
MFFNLAALDFQVNSAAFFLAFSPRLFASSVSAISLLMPAARAVGLFG